MTSILCACKPIYVKSIDINEFMESISHTGSMLIFEFYRYKLPDKSQAFPIDLSSVGTHKN